MTEQQLLTAYRRHAQPHSGLAVMCFSENLETAELVSQHLTDVLTAHGISAHAQTSGNGPTSSPSTTVPGGSWAAAAAATSGNAAVMS